MKKIRCLLFAGLLLPLTANAQENAKRISNFHLGLDVQTKYIWRGMEMMTEDAAPVLFPGLNYSNKGLYAYVMGGYAINGKYSGLILV